MATKLAALLRTSSMGLPELANVLQSKGRNGDTILAHINPKEAKLLKRMGGAGTLNPYTGLPEFYEGQDTEDAPTYILPAEQPGPGSAEYMNQEAATPASTQGLPDVNVPTPDVNRQQFQTMPEQAPATDYSFNLAAPTASQGLQAAPSTQGYELAQPQPQGLQPVSSAFGLAAPSDLAPGVGATPTTTAEQPSMFAGMGDKLDTLAKALGTDRMGLLKMGIGGVGALQGAGASRQAQGAAEATQKQIESLGAPYKERGQQLVAMGQAGQLTPAQQQSLAALRAQQAQQLQRMGQSGGGTASMQAEAQIQNMAQQFAQQNIDQGMKLINLSDKYVMDAIKQGYSQSKDATAMSGDFYKTLLSSIPGATQQAAPAQAKVAGT